MSQSVEFEGSKNLHLQIHNKDRPAESCLSLPSKRLENTRARAKLGVWALLSRRTCAYNFVGEFPSITPVLLKLQRLHAVYNQHVMASQRAKRQ